jgi:hypothetical protein
MGDHRASIKIQVSAHGIEDQCDMWINYWPDDGGYGPDKRILDFFENWWKKARDKYDDEMEAYESSRNKERLKESRRLEYERLKAEFEPEEG